MSLDNLDLSFAAQAASFAQPKPAPIAPELQRVMREAVASRERTPEGPPPIRSNGAPPHEGRTGAVRLAAPQERVTLIRGDSVALKPIDWLWPCWLARGKLHIIGGAPGAGKTTLALSLAATLTSGGFWPDRIACRNKGRVIVWSGEDGLDDTLAPRLIHMGADISQVFFVGGVKDSASERPFDPARDIEPLKHAIEEAGGADMIIVDPIVSATSGDSHKNAEVRRGLKPLVDLANGLGAALVGITHFSKGTSGKDPVERLTGSLAFGAVARVVMVAAKATEPTGAERIFCRAKSNIGPDSGGFGYELHQGTVAPGIVASVVHWREPIEGSAREILGEAEAVEADGSAKDEAEAFLKDFLADGAKPVNDVKAAAVAHCIAWATVRRAQKALGVKSDKDGMKGGWAWRLAEDAQNTPKVPTPERWASSDSDEHLREG